MSWDAMVATASTQLREDYGLAEARHEDAAWHDARQGYGVSFKQGYRVAWWQAVEWVLTQQGMWESLTEAEAIAELRKSSGSVYYPLFAADPRVFADCPNHGRVSTGPEGRCDQCTYDFTRRS